MQLRYTAPLLEEKRSSSICDNYATTSYGNISDDYNPEE
jgi:hypothetical protein